MTKEELTKLMLRGKGLSARAWKIRTLAKYDGEFEYDEANCGLCTVREWVTGGCKFCPLYSDSSPDCCLEWQEYSGDNTTANAISLYKRIQSLDIAKWVDMIESRDLDDFEITGAYAFEVEFSDLEVRIEYQERKYVS